MSLRVKWDKGVSIECGDVQLIFDPQSNDITYPRAFITHAHLDHAKAFSIPYLTKFSSRETKDLLAIYGGETTNWKPLSHGKGVSFDDVEIVSHNSGHVLGSSQYEVITPGGNVVYTGDINFSESKTMKVADIVPCDILVLEATFGSPSFVFPPEDQIATDMVQWAINSLKQGKIPAFQTDPLGNAQEIIKIFNELTRIPVTTHHRVTAISQVYEAYGHKLDYLDANSEEAAEVTSSGECIFIAPKGLNLSKYAEFDSALVSGWALWAKRKAFALSDHADFPHLIDFVRECRPKTLLTCHGGRFNETLVRHIEKRLGIEARPLDLIPTTLFPKHDEARIRECGREILKIAKVPSFSYSKKMIARGVTQLGFSSSEINLALKMLTEQKILQVLKEGKSFQSKLTSLT